MTELDPDLVAAFWAFVQERQAIWHRRFVLQQPRPWTEDPVLQAGHYTNVFRWLDPGTQLSIVRLREAPSRQDAIYWTVAYRQLNRAETFETFGTAGPWVANHAAWLSHLATRKADGHSLGTKRPAACSSLPAYTTALTASIDLKVPEDAPGAFDALSSLPRVGSFIAWQALVDLTYHAHVTAHPTFVVLGPGAANAAELLISRRVLSADYHWRHAAVASPQHAEVVRDLAAGQPTLLTRWTVRLSLADVEHCLCEWFRYQLARLKLEAS